MRISNISVKVTGGGGSDDGIQIFDTKPYLDKGIFQELRDLHPFRGIPILTPRQFLDWLAEIKTNSETD